jgi:glycosyltransferase involved in cell wall biosynthesis
MLSAVIPSRSDQYLQKTVDSLLNKAEGDVEVIVVYDGRWAEPILRDDPRLIQMHHGEVHNNYGMRDSINAGVRLASGDYILVIDEQCDVDQGYDVKLAADCEDDWVVVPRRKRLDADKWELINDGRPDIDYMYVEYPYVKPLDKTQGLHGAEWKRPERADILIDDTPTMQGSCYFMKKSYWQDLDSTNYGTFTQEAQEVSMRVWLSGGRVVVNKKTWYAHFHKGKAGKGYGFSNEQYKRHCEGMEKGRLYAINYWLNTQDYKHDWNWFVTKMFKDMPGWSKDWRERIERDRLKDYSTLNYANDHWLEGLRK